MGRLLCLGLSHSSAPLQVREQLAFSPTALSASLARFSPLHRNGGLEGVTEVAILSTCNRLEVYAVVRDPDVDGETLTQFLAEARDVPADSFRDHLYTHTDEDAARHLMTVASGLDSLVLGEPQILGQVVDAYKTAMAHSAVETVLNKLFQAAIHAGKRARTETAISMNAASISSVAVQLASHVFGDLTDCEVLVAGAGEMGELAVQALMKRGARGLLVANRTYDRAVQLARLWDGEAMTFERLGEGLERADIAITSTNAPHTILSVEQVATAMQSRPDRPLFLIDIALPRDVEVEAGTLDNVHLYNIDDLQSTVENNLDERRAEVPRVEAIVEEEVESFAAWLAALQVVPTITGLRDRAETIRRDEVERALSRLDVLSDEQREIVFQLSTRLVNKLLHSPITTLKHEAANGNGVEYTQAVRDLFGLEPKP